MITDKVPWVRKCAIRQSRLCWVQVIWRITHLLHCRCRLWGAVGSLRFGVSHLNSTVFALHITDVWAEHFNNPYYRRNQNMCSRSGRRKGARLTSASLISWELFGNQQYLQQMSITVSWAFSMWRCVVFFGNRNLKFFINVLVWLEVSSPTAYGGDDLLTGDNFLVGCWMASSETPVL